MPSRCLRSANKPLPNKTNFDVLCDRETSTATVWRDERNVRQRLAVIIRLIASRA